jgi:acyl carrier protein
VLIDLEAIKHEISNVDGVQDLALRTTSSGSLEGYVYVKDRPELDSSDITTSISWNLPGYSIPESLHVLRSPLIMDGNAVPDFGLMQIEVSKQDTSSMNELEILVRNLFAEILKQDTGKIKRDSDFFLLGGSSLLLGHMSFHARKRTGVSVTIQSLFANSTVCGIASAIQDKLNEVPRASMLSLVEAGRRSIGPSRVPLRSDYEEDFEDLKQGLSRGQTHVLSLIVQALPLVFIHPMKATLTCRSFH